MNLPRFETVFCIDPKVCPTCDHLVRASDRTTGLCVDCWRVVILAPAALTALFGAETREPPPPGDAARDGVAKTNPNAARVLG